jgi:hypothetical protein
MSNMPEISAIINDAVEQGREEMMSEVQVALNVFIERVRTSPAPQENKDSIINAMELFQLNLPLLNLPAEMVE